MFNFILPQFFIKVERWKWNKEYRIYVSNMGHFMDKYKKIIPIRVNQKGYAGIFTSYGFMSAHRLVMRTWRPTANMENLTVDHLDHNKRNNSVENLEWVTETENKKRARADYFDENAKPKKSKETKTLSFVMDEFYPTINGIAFDDVKTAWWYCQEILDKGKKNDCTLKGIEDKFESLLRCYNANNQDYITGKRKMAYCGLKLSFVLKGNKNKLS